MKTNSLSKLPKQANERDGVFHFAKPPLFRVDRVEPECAYVVVSDTYLQQRYLHQRSRAHKAHSYLNTALDSNNWCQSDGLNIQAELLLGHECHDWLDRCNVHLFICCKSTSINQLPLRDSTYYLIKKVHYWFLQTSTHSKLKLFKEKDRNRKT